MKRLISLIVVAILTMFLAGCVVVDERCDYGPRPGAVIVTRPWAAPHYYGYYHRHWYHHHRY
jgi:hypothetical protein